MPDEDREDQLRGHQDGRVYPLGRALRATYDADNHDTLGSDVTGLMIDLSKVPYEPVDPAAMRREAMHRQPLAQPRSWRERLGGIWHGRYPVNPTG